MRHFITLDDVSVPELYEIFDHAIRIKADYKRGKRHSLLANKMIGMIFEKASLRTRVSFESGIAHLGGNSMFLGSDVGFGKRETTADFSRVLSSMVDAIVFRANRHQDVVEMAQYASCPVINALTDEAHPCQVLADMLTVQEEYGNWKGLRIAWVGDSNNVAASLVRICSKLGVGISIASPEGYQFSDEQLQRLVGPNPTKGFFLETTTDPATAALDAHVVYTDVWVSMGQEKEEAERKQILAPFQVNAELMSKTAPNAIFLHCLPAKRGQEVTDEVMDSPQSRVVQQAENRMHAQKGLLVWLIE